MTANADTGGDILIEPTILLRLYPEEDRMQFVSTKPGSDREEALIVFRNKEDAAAFQESTGKFTEEEEGFGRVGIGHEGIAKILEMQGIPYVAMPMGWTGDDSDVPCFAGANFIQLLEGLTD